MEPQDQPEKPENEQPYLSLRDLEILVTSAKDIPLEVHIEVGGELATYADFLIEFSPGKLDTPKITLRIW